MKKAEKYLILVIALGVALKLAIIPGGTFLLVLSACSLSLLYFAFGWKILFIGPKIIQNRILAAITGISIAILLLGSFFKFSIYPGGGTLLFSGLGLGIPLITVIFFAYRKANEETLIFYKSILLKLTVYTVIGLILYSIPMKKMIQIRNWNDPKLADLHYLHFSNPDNQSYRDNYNAYVEESNQ
jgi:hypothetical protein